MVTKDPAGVFPTTEGQVGQKFLTIAVNQLATPAAAIFPINQLILKGEKLFIFSNGSSNNKTVSIQLTPVPVVAP